LHCCKVATSYINLELRSTATLFFDQWDFKIPVHTIKSQPIEIMCQVPVILLTCVNGTALPTTLVGERQRNCRERNTHIDLSTCATHDVCSELFIVLACTYH